MVLERELQYFERHKEELLSRYEGQFVLIEGENLVGNYASLKEAYEAGVTRFGRGPFLVKQVVAGEETVHIPALVLGLTRASSS